MDSLTTPLSQSLSILEGYNIRGYIINIYTDFVLNGTINNENKNRYLLNLSNIRHLLNLFYIKLYSDDDYAVNNAIFGYLSGGIPILEETIKALIRAQINKNIGCLLTHRSYHGERTPVSLFHRIGPVYDRYRIVIELLNYMLNFW